MTGSAIVVLSVAVLYLVACLVVGMLPGKRSSDSATGYVAGDRALGTLVMYFITGATIFSAFAFLGAPGWAYSRGASVFYILGYGALWFSPFYFVGPRASRLGKAFGFVTQAEMVSARFGMRSIAGVMAITSVIAFVPYLALQMEGAGYVVSEVTEGHVPTWAGSAIVYAVVLVYVAKSGVLGVGWTNTLQGVFMMVLAWVLGLYLPWKLYGGVGPMFDAIEQARPELLKAPGMLAPREDGSQPPWTWAGYSSALIVSVIGFSFWPHLFMKAFTAKSERVLKRTVVLYPTFQIFIVPLLLIGFAGVLFTSSPDQPDRILPHMLMRLDLSPIVVGLFCAGALAASMSSGDAIAHAAASILVRDGGVTALKMELDQEQQRKAIRLLLVPVIAAAYVLSLLYEGSIVKLLLYAYGPVSQFAPAVVATLYFRRATGIGVLAGLVAGMVVQILFTVRADAMPFAMHAGVYGLGANVLVLTLVSALTRPSGDSGFLDVAAGRVREG